METLNILLAEDHLLVREGLRLLFDSQKDLKIICEAEDGREAVKMAKQHKPDIIVLDIAMPKLNGIEAARQILAAMPKIRIVILSAHADDAYLEKALALGVSGYLIKQTSASILTKVIRDVAKGGTYFSPSLSKRLSLFQKGQNSAILKKRSNANLTSRETEVLQLIAEGMANKQTASELRISIKTVEKHRQSLMDKLHLHDTAALTRYAISSGMIENSIQVTTI